MITHFEHYTALDYNVLMSRINRGAGNRAMALLVCAFFPTNDASIGLHHQVHYVLHSGRVDGDRFVNNNVQLQTLPNKWPTCYARVFMRFQFHENPTKNKSK